MNRTAISISIAIVISSITVSFVAHADEPWPPDELYIYRTEADVAAFIANSLAFEDDENHDDLFNEPFVERRDNTTNIRCTRSMLGSYSLYNDPGTSDYVYAAQFPWYYGFSTRFMRYCSGWTKLEGSFHCSAN